MSIDDLINKVNTIDDYTHKLAKSNEVKDKLQMLNREIWIELDKKHETRIFD